MKNYQLTILLITLCIISVILETTVINFPAVYLLGSILAVAFKKIPVLIGAFILSFVIDAMRVSNFGVTAIFIFATIIIIMLYEKYSGSGDLLVASFVIAVMLFTYSHLLSYSTTLVVLFFGISLISLYIFSILKKKGKIF